MRTKLMSLLVVAFAATSAHAALVTKDLGDVSITVDSDFFKSFDVKVQGTELVLSTQSYNAAASSPSGSPYSVASDSFDPNPGSAWLYITPNDDTQVITSVTESITGGYSGGVNRNSASSAYAGLDFKSVWVDTGAVTPLISNQTSKLVLSLEGVNGAASDEGTYKLTQTTNFNGFAAVSLASFIMNVGAMASGPAIGFVGNYANISATEYRLGVSVGDATAVPEPQNLALILGGLGVVGFRLSRRARAD